MSIDQLESTTPGLIAQLRGKPTTKRYRVATVFVDQFSKLSYVHMQKGGTAIETLEAKLAFERYARSFGIKVSHYHADNGIFADKLFQRSIENSGQTLSFCGVNAHWQNGVAERRIRELQDLARTMMIHANRRWPSAIETYLWPYALRLANEQVNNTPIMSRKDNLTPMTLFTGGIVQINAKHWRHFGCPAYELDKELQAGKKIPKWNDRSRVGIYLGPSPQHARNISLVMNLTTGLCSPAFHVTFDPTFETMRRSFGNYPPFSKWQEACRFKKLTKSIDPVRAPRREPLDPIASVEPAFVQEGEEEQRHDANDYEEDEINPNQGDWNEHQAGDEEQPPEEPPPPEPPPNAPNATTTRSGRQSRRPRRLIEIMMANAVAHEALGMDLMEDEQESKLEEPIQAYAASADPDTMYLHEALRQPDRHKFIEAMQKEVKDHIDKGIWEVVPASKVPEGVTIVPMVWAMKRKRRIATGEPYKWKARLNVDGSKQKEGEHFWETYAPVASWPTIRMALIMALLNGWKTKQIDYVLAFPQAEVECEMYMKLPKGFEVDKDGDYVLRLNKNLYGMKQAGRVWNKYLVERLLRIGFKQSEHDECLFYRGNVIYVLYTDDSILMGTNEKELDEVIALIEAQGLELTVEGDISDFLGVELKREADGSINCTQPQLIKKILEDLRLAGDGVATKEVPARVGKVLGKESNTKRFDGHFDYRSVIGKINYLEKSTRADIAFATHQCARFSSDPKESHGKALKWLGRYLAQTKDRGMILKPDIEHSFDCYVDADFCGGWDQDDALEDPATAKSRTGYVIMYAGCPVVWSSKMQTEVTLSTTEAEYVALSSALKQTIWLMNIVREMKEQGFNATATHPKIHCKAFEDNSGALTIANVPKARPRTKHINVKYHFFRQYVASGDVSIHKIDTKDQCADMLTKPLSKELHEKHRRFIQGW